MRSRGAAPSQTSSLLFAVSQHRLFNEHLVSASSNPALAMRRKKHTEKEVHADLVSIVSVRLREGYSIREVNITKGDCARWGLGQGSVLNCLKCRVCHLSRVTGTGEKGDLFVKLLSLY